MTNKDKKNSNTKPVEEMILKEIAGRPHDIELRIQLVKFLLEEKRIDDAFKYCFDLEMKCIESFLGSIDWYTIVSTVLSHTRMTMQDTWNYWCLLLISFEKQIYLNLKKDLSLPSIMQTNLKEVTNLMFEFDQSLKNLSDILHSIAPVSEMGDEFLNHFRGQMALHIASLLFKRQKTANTDQWHETVKKSLPFLLYAFQSSTVNTETFWVKNTSEVMRNLFIHLKKEGAFRCAQAARTILACKSYKNDYLVKGSNLKCWFTIDEIFNQVRETCADLNWRKNYYRFLFANTDQQLKISNSYFVQNNFFQEPNYEQISFNDIDMYENMAQYLYPSSLSHHVYLGLGRNDLHSYKCRTFSGLKFSTSNLINCNPETINRIDIDSFLYCAIIQAKRMLEAEKESYESFSNKLNEKPLILPAANLIEGLCSEEQSEWWLAAFKIYKNISGENLAQLKATLQFGLEAVRGIDSPKVDVIILFKLGDILLARATSCDKSDERRHLDLRVEYIYKFAMRMLRNKDSDSMRRIFKYPSNNYDLEREIEKLTESAIGHLSSIYFKKEEYKEFIEDFAGIQNPWVHFFRAESYKKLDESSKTPKNAKKLYNEKARESLMETLTALEQNEHIDTNNLLRLRVEKDLKQLQFDLSASFNDELDHYNTSQNGFTDDENYQNASSSSFRARKEFSSTNFNERFKDIETLVRNLTDTVIAVKDDILCVRNNISGLKDEIFNIRGDIADLNANKDASTAKAMNDINKSIEELTCYFTYLMNIIPNPAGAQAINPALRFQQNQIQSQLNQIYNTAYPIYPLQYPPVAASSRTTIPQQITPNMSQFNETIGVNLVMGTPNYGNNVMPSQQQQQQQYATSSNGQKSSLLEALNTPTLLNTWNNTYNHIMPSISTNSNSTVASPVISTSPSIVQHKPIEKTPPVNVVITSSDPLPAQNTIVSQPTLSVTIPIQHIKHSATQFQNTSINMKTSQSSSSNALQYENVSPSKPESTLEYYEEAADYDPRPDFKPIIPLPAEIQVKTGEENEEILFEERAKLFRLADKEWKERGIGYIKILKDKETHKSRVVMRRDQIHKLCANHIITSEMEMKKTQKDTTLMWAANDYSEEQMVLEKFLVRFKEPKQAKEFLEVFNSAKMLTPKESKSYECTKKNDEKVIIFF
jgi:E3 SUMO-protein ligase RanBP2